MEKTVKKAYVGLDDGNFNTKLIAILEENGVKSAPIQLSIPTRIALGTITQINGLSGITNAANIYEFNGTKYTVFDADDKSVYSNIIDPRNLVYHETVENVIMAKHAIKMAGIDDTYELNLVTGLPFRDYFTFEGSVNKENQTKKIENFSLKWDLVECLDNKKSPKITSHNILSEGAGAYLNELFEFNGGESINRVTTELNRGPVAFVDIGGRTIDIVTFTKNGKNIINDYSDTSEYGALDLSNEVAKGIKNSLKIKTNLLPDKIDEAIRTGKYYARGQDYDVSEIVSSAKQTFCNRLELEIKGTLKNADDIALIVFVGGGSQLVREQLEDIYEQSHFIENPDLANAKGFLKACLIIFVKK